MRTLQNIRDVMVVREAAVSRAFLKSLQDHRLVFWRTKLHDLTFGEQEAAENLKNILEELIGTEPNVTRRRGLLNLKRAVHNQRISRARKQIDMLREDGLQLASLDRWLTLVDQIDTHHKQGRVYFEKYWKHADERILVEIARGDIGSSISSSSEALADALRSRHKLKPKQYVDAVRSGGQYVLRAATRTTPFGGFTRVGIVDGSTSPEGIGNDASAPEVRRHPKLNIEVLAALRNRLLAHPAVRGSLTVRLTDGIAFEDGRVRYVRRKSGEASTGGRITQRSEDVFFLSNDTLLESIFYRFQQQLHWNLTELVDTVAQDLAGIVTRDECEDYLFELLRQSFLVVPAFEISIFDVDPLSRLENGLKDFSGAFIDDVRDRLLSIQQTLTTLAQDEVGLDEALDGIRAIRGHFLDLGLSREAIPQPLVYMDSRNYDSVAVDSAQAQRTYGDHLRSLTQILPIFDILLPDKLLMHGYFKARFGKDHAVDSFLDFIQEFNEDLYDVYRERVHASPRIDADGAPIPALNWLDQPEITELNRARRQLMQDFAQRFARASAQGDPVLELDDAFFSDNAPNLPEQFFRTNYSVNLQPKTSIEKDGQAVINGYYSGNGLMMSRFLHTEAEDSPVVTRLRDILRESESETMVLAEISGGHDSTNLNLHRQTIDYQIICPGEGMRCEPDRAIRLEELEVRADAAGVPQLWCERLGKTVIPVYQGFLIPYALPAIQRVLLLFSRMTVPVMDLWSGVDPPLGDKQISSHPRVVYGPLVLVREVWKMRPEFLPRRASLDDGAWFALLEDWRVAQKLPKHVFATIDLPPEREGEQPGRTKPQFVDFDNPWTLWELDRMVEKAFSRVVMVEALPDPVTEVADGAGTPEHRATELVMEVVA